MISLLKSAFFIILYVAIFFSGQSFASTLNPYLVIDVKNGAILSAHREYDHWYPASLTKLMTAYVTMKAISEGRIATGSPVRISNKAHKMPPSRMGYKTGVLLRVDVALKILIVKSANDVAVALAESVGGSIKNFVTQMNKNAGLLGMTATHFVSPTGLHSTNQFTSARDMAILARRILLDFPQYFSWFSIPAIRTETKTHYSYNLLLERFKGANGMKTGFVCASGYNMVASAKRNNRQLIAIVLGEKSQTARAVLSARLLKEAFVQKTPPIGNIMIPETYVSAPPENMRSILCSREARKHHYNPAAGKAVIKSPYLSERKITRLPVLVRTEGFETKPEKNKPFLPISNTSLPIPAKRP